MTPIPRTPASLLLLALLAGAALLGTGCVVSTAISAAKAQPAGSVTLTSAALGDHTLQPAECRSGEHQLFLGADFLDGQGIVTRLIVAPTGGASLRFFAAAHPLEPGVLFRREDCGRFELTLFRRPLPGPRPAIGLTATWDAQGEAVVLAEIQER